MIRDDLMEKMIERLAWIDQKNRLQREWALAYFDKYHPRRYKINRNRVNYNDYIDLINSTDRNDGLTIEFLRRMKEAWKQKTIRSKKDGRKSDTNIIKITTINKLKKLADEEKIPKNKMLENIIEHYFDGIKIDKQEHSIVKDKLSKATTELTKIKNKIRGLNEDKEKILKAFRDYNTLLNGPKEKEQEMNNALGGKIEEIERLIQELNTNY